MKKKNDFKRKNAPLEQDEHKEKRTSSPPPTGDIEDEIRAMREAMRNLDNLSYARRQLARPVPPITPETIPDSIEELYRRLKRLEVRLDILEQRVAANPYDPETQRQRFEAMIRLLIGAMVCIFVFALLLSGC